MGSDSDWPVMKAAATALEEFDVALRGRRRLGAPDAARRCSAYGKEAAGRGLQVIIAGAGGAAHLPGMLAAVTPLPVIGVPVPLEYLDGLDSLLSIVQMPAGVPVATVAIGNARNAGLLAVRILAASDAALRQRMVEFQADARGAPPRPRARRSATTRGPPEGAASEPSPAPEARRARRRTLPGAAGHGGRARPRRARRRRHAHPDQRLVDGRASALFAVLAGVSLVLMTGAGPPVGRERLARSAGLAVRALLVALARAGAGRRSDSGLAIILTYYGVLFLLGAAVPGPAGPRPVRLAVGWAVLAPVVSHLAAPAPAGAGLRQPVVRPAAGPRLPARRAAAHRLLPGAAVAGLPAARDGDRPARPALAASVQAVLAGGRRGGRRRCRPGLAAP